MTRSGFLLEMDEILDLPAGTLQGNENLEDLEGWDSLALVTLIALVETVNSVHISPPQIVSCRTVADIMRLAQIEGVVA